MIKICVISGEKEIILNAEKGDNLYATLINNKIAIDGSCGGHKTCGKCLTKIISGEVDPPTETEAKFMGEKNLKKGLRLACHINLSGDVTVMPVTQKGDAQIMIGGLDSALMSDCEDGFAVGIDIGTTTIAAFLLDLSTGKTIATQSGLNAQRPYGADVISRCEYALKDGKGMEVLSKLICEQINDLLIALCEQSNINISDIIRVTLVGNPTMMHLVKKLDVQGIAVAPYKPSYYDMFTVPASELKLSLQPDVPVVFLPVISGFVGADTISAIIASGMDQSDDMSLMIDIGTNGEIALGSRKRILTCAAAAGPAFEGGKISCGTGGVQGAVDKVYADGKDYAARKNLDPANFENDEGFRFTTIGDKPAKGICGSGLIDLISVLCKKGCIEDTGLLSADNCASQPYNDSFDENGSFVLADIAHGAESTVSLTQKDVREVQLAKSAISAGIDILALRMGISLEDIQHVYLAGGFGNYIDIISACDIGLLPKIIESRIIGIGNAAGTGARMTACSEEYRKRAQYVAEFSEYIELAEAKEFADEFMENMLFPTYD